MRGGGGEEERQDDTLLLLPSQVWYGWRKVCLEFMKRNDPDLPFYYHTSTHTRFYETEMPNFNQPAEKQRQLSRPPRRELLGSNVGRRITFAVRGAGSIRSTFHNMPVELPPLPTESGNVLLEHAYAASVANRNSK